MKLLNPEDIRQAVAREKELLENLIHAKADEAKAADSRLRQIHEGELEKALVALALGEGPRDSVEELEFELAELGKTIRRNSIIVTGLRRRMEPFPARLNEANEIERKLSWYAKSKRDVYWGIAIKTAYEDRVTKTRDKSSVDRTLSPEERSLMAGIKSNLQALEAFAATWELEEDFQEWRARLDESRKGARE